MEGKLRSILFEPTQVMRYGSKCKLTAIQQFNEWVANHGNPTWAKIDTLLNSLNEVIIVLYYYEENQDDK